MVGLGGGDVMGGWRVGAGWAADMVSWRRVLEGMRRGIVVWSCGGAGDGGEYSRSGLIGRGAVVSLMSYQRTLQCLALENRAHTPHLIVSKFNLFPTIRRCLHI